MNCTSLSKGAFTSNTGASNITDKHLAETAGRRRKNNFMKCDFPKQSHMWWEQQWKWKKYSYDILVWLNKSKCASRLHCIAMHCPSEPLISQWRPLNGPSHAPWTSVSAPPSLPHSCGAMEEKFKAGIVEELVGVGCITLSGFDYLDFSETLKTYTFVKGDWRVEERRTLNKLLRAL